MSFAKLGLGHTHCNVAHTYFKIDLTELNGNEGFLNSFAKTYRPMTTASKEGISVGLGPFELAISYFTYSKMYRKRSVLFP